MYTPSTSLLEKAKKKLAIPFFLSNTTNNLTWADFFQTQYATQLFILCTLENFQLSSSVFILRIRGILSGSGLNNIHKSPHASYFFCFPIIFYSLK